jgi:uncharacterized membrane protein
VAPFLLLTLLARINPRFEISAPARARAGLSLFFAFTALGHFIRTNEMAAMLPDSMPYRVEVIYLTGVFEFLGAIGIWLRKVRKLTGACLILMLIAILPANIYSAINHVEFGGHESGPVYLLIRVPFQLLLIVWTYYASEQNWWRRKTD